MQEISIAARRQKEEADKQNLKLKADILHKDLQTQMSTPQGRRFVWRVLKKLSYNTPIVEVSAKVYGAVAKQEVALDIARELKQACREEFYMMETEAETDK